jgi:hypothetical protein
VIGHRNVGMASQWWEIQGAPQVEVAEQFRALRRAADRVTEWKPPYCTFKVIEGTRLARNPSPNLAGLDLSDGTTHTPIAIPP